MLGDLFSIGFMLMTPVLLTTEKHMTESRLAKLITVVMMLVLGIMIGLAWS